MGFSTGFPGDSSRLGYPSPYLRARASGRYTSPSPASQSASWSFLTRERCASRSSQWDKFEDLELYGILREQWIRNTEPIA
jgi:hypothetical protein